MTDYGSPNAGTLVGTDDYMALLVNAYDGNGWQELEALGQGYSSKSFRTV